MAKCLEADEINVNRLWQIEANRTKHLQNLGTIYRQKEAVKQKLEKDYSKRLRQLGKYQHSKIRSLDYKNKSHQDKINYENAILRNKILDVFRDTRKAKANSAYVTSANKINPHKANHFEEVYRTNLKIGERLACIKSQVKQICNFQEHSKKSDMLFELVTKKSPQKKAYLRNLARKKFSSDRILPNLSENSFFE